jgi:SAM-dependent methyltransferase
LDNQRPKEASAVLSFLSGLEIMPLIDLGNHGYADTFIPLNRLTESEPTFPLVVGGDLQSGIFQNMHPTPAFDRYNAFEYSYTSSNSLTSKEHWHELLLFLKKKFELEKLSILEIGSNDGYLLKLLQEAGSACLGVDASGYLTDLANSSGIKTLNIIFANEQTLLDQIQSALPNIDLIIANNVVNHSDNIQSFFEAIATLLKPNGYFIFEVPYWSKMIQDKTFDQIYHEHVYYFTAQGVKKIAEHFKLSVSEIGIVDYHGGSLRVVLKKGDCQVDPNLAKLIAEEIDQGLFDQGTYELYQIQLALIKDKFRKTIEKYRSREKDIKIVGIGAAAKANTFLTFVGATSLDIDFIVDTSKYKIGKYTPVSRIPIRDEEDLPRTETFLALILAWNLYEFIAPKIKTINRRVIIINNEIF